MINADDLPINGAELAGRAPGWIRRWGLELAVTLGALGLVAGVAVPRHAADIEEVRRTEVHALAGSLTTAAELGHGLWKIQGRPALAQSERGRISIVEGYPSAGDLPTLLDPSEARRFIRSGDTWQYRDLPPRRPCGVSYAPPAADGLPPVVEEHVSGC